MRPRRKTTEPHRSESAWAWVGSLLAVLAAVAALVAGAGYMEQDAYATQCLRVAFPDRWIAPGIETPRYLALGMGAIYCSFVVLVALSVYAGAKIGRQVLTLMGRRKPMTEPDPREGDKTAVATGPVVATLVGTLVMGLLMLGLVVARGEVNAPVRSAASRWVCDNLTPIFAIGGGLAMFNLIAIARSVWVAHCGQVASRDWGLVPASVYSLLALFILAPSLFGLDMARRHRFPLVHVHVTSAFDSRDRAVADQGAEPPYVRGYLVAETPDTWVIRLLDGTGRILSKSRVSQIDLVPGCSATLEELAPLPGPAGLPHP